MADAAVDTHGAESAAHGAAHGGDAASAFPPFDTSLFASQLFWFAVTFGALYFALSRYILPFTAGVLAKRDATVTGDLTAASEKSTAAEAARVGMEQALAKARADARATVDAQRAAVTAELAAEQEKADAAIAQRIDAAEARITDTRAKALADVDAVAKDVAASIVGKLMPAGATR